MASKIPKEPAPSLTIKYLRYLASSSLAPSSIVEILADLESTACLTQLNPSTSDLLSNFYSIYMIALFLCDDLNEARFLSKRIPIQHLQSDPLIISSYTLLRAVYTRNYQKIYTVFDSAPWSEEIYPLVVRFRDYFRHRTLVILSRAYTTISPALAAMYLGFTTEEKLSEYVKPKGWEPAEAGLLKPVRMEIGEVGTECDAEGSDMRISVLSGFVTHLTGL